jgi:predicted Zn-dependent peptidase
MLLGQVETLYGLSYLEAYLEKISAVASEDVSSVCSRYLTPANRTVGYLVPDGSSAAEDAEEGDDEDA